MRGVASDPSFDLVVVGTGAAGLSAALSAAILGLRPLVIEATDKVGGTSAYSAGSAWIPNTRHAATVGAEDSLESAALYLRSSVGNESPEAMRRAFLSRGPEAVALLEDNSQLLFRARTLHPDYNSDLPGATLKGRVLEAVPFDGRKLGKLFDLVREPIPEFTILGGMMVNQEDVLALLSATRSVKSFTHAVKLLARHGVDRLSYRRGTRLMMGNALIARFLVSLADRNVPILVNTAVTNIHSDDDGPVAVTLEQDGYTQRVSFRGGLVAATGGFNRNAALRERLLRKPVTKFCPLAPGYRGALHDQLFEVGGHYGEDDRDTAFWSPVSVRKRADGSVAVFPHFIFDRGRPGTITVNQAGERFVNEALSYHPFTQGQFAANAVSPSIPAYLIADETALRKYGLGMVRPGRMGRTSFLRDGYLTSAPSLPELARKLGVDADNLVATVACFNGFARDGVDPDFGRGSTEYQRITAGDMAHAPNPCLGTLERAPFHAVRIFPGDMGATVGFSVNENAQMLRKDGSPIARLYACGNDMHSVMGGNYPGPGITLGPAIVFGYAAARDMANRLT